jgi:hypothetical protein
MKVSDSEFDHGFSVIWDLRFRPELCCKLIWHSGLESAAVSSDWAAASKIAPSEVHARSFCVGSQASWAFDEAEIVHYRAEGGARLIGLVQFYMVFVRHAHVMPEDGCSNVRI